MFTFETWLFVVFIVCDSLIYSFSCFIHVIASTMAKKIMKNFCLWEKKNISQWEYIEFDASYVEMLSTQLVKSVKPKMLFNLQLNKFPRLWMHWITHFFIHMMKWYSYYRMKNTISKMIFNLRINKFPWASNHAPSTYKVVFSSLYVYCATLDLCPT
jgi:hypothetical protein